MLMVSMGVSVDGYISDRSGSFDWTAPDEELFRFHHESVSELGAVILGRRLYETMLVWETDAAMREDKANAAFGDVWTALPKLVFSRTLDRVQGNARLATGSVADEVPAFLASADGDVEIGGATLVAEAIELGLVDEFRIFRHPIIVGGGIPLLPPVSSPIPLHLADTRTFASGVIYERYLRARG